MNNFWKRAITGTIFVMVLVGAILLGGWYMHITFGLFGLLGLLEFYKLFETTETKPQRIAGTIIGTLLYTSVILMNAPFARPLPNLFFIILIAILMTGFVWISIFELTRSSKKPFENISITYAGIFYVIIPFLLLNILADSPRPLTINGTYNFWPVLSIFILIWSNDTFAYLAGRSIGKHKLFERISPKKTWEGFIGGVVFAIIAGILLAYFLDQSYVRFIVYALVVSVIGTLGDLVESMLKRSVDVKDSGTILPGHGGILDRFDAVLFVVPVIFFLEKFIFTALD